MRPQNRVEGDREGKENGFKEIGRQGEIAKAPIAPTVSPARFDLGSNPCSEVRLPALS